MELAVVRGPHGRGRGDGLDMEAGKGMQRALASFTFSPRLGFHIIIRACEGLLPLLSLSILQSRVSSTEQEHGLPVDCQGLILV